MAVYQQDMLRRGLNIKMMLMWITVILFHEIDLLQTNGVYQQNPLVTATVGDDVTLHCFQLDSATPIVWYKQKTGQGLLLLAVVQQDPSYENGFNPPKFSIEKRENSCHLKISNVEPSDEAMYYCGAIKYLTVFGEGSYLSLKGKHELNVSVFQIGMLSLVPVGELVTLQCSVLSDSRVTDLQVLWFKAATPQSNPQIIYKHLTRSHRCESDSSTHTCVYNFSKNILNLNDTGTYYCAVAMCGKIIFGNGTIVQLAGTADHLVVYLAVALGMCVLVIFVQAIFGCQKRGYEQCMVTFRKSSMEEKTPNQDCRIEELNYAALNYHGKRTKRGRGKREQAQESEVIYSHVA